MRMRCLSKMVALSKPTLLQYSCYELGHTWTPSCRKASFDVALLVFKEAVKIYGSLYFVCRFLLLFVEPNPLKKVGGAQVKKCRPNSSTVIYLPVSKTPSEDLELLVRYWPTAY